MNYTNKIFYKQIEYQDLVIARVSKLTIILLTFVFLQSYPKNIQAQEIDSDTDLGAIFTTALEEEYYANRQFLEVLKLKPYIKIFQMFRNIAVAEANHAEQILHMTRKYQITIAPSVKDTKPVSKVTNIKQACEIGRKLEEDQYNLYAKKLIPAVRGIYPDVTATFVRIAVDSKNRLERFFDRCLKLYEKSEAKR